MPAGMTGRARADWDWTKAPTAPRIARASPAARPSLDPLPRRLRAGLRPAAARRPAAPAPAAGRPGLGGDRAAGLLGADAGSAVFGHRRGRPGDAAERRHGDRHLAGAAWRGG